MTNRARGGRCRRLGGSIWPSYAFAVWHSITQRIRRGYGSVVLVAGDAVDADAQTACMSKIRGVHDAHPSWKPREQRVFIKYRVTALLVLDLDEYHGQLWIRWLCMRQSVVSGGADEADGQSASTERGHRRGTCPCEPRTMEAIMWLCTHVTNQQIVEEEHFEISQKEARPNFTTRQKRAKMERLPDDLMVTLPDFLSGVNVLMLSHANRRLYLLLSDANVWTPRLGRPSKGQPRPRLAMPRCREKMEYTTHKTVLSQPVDVDDPSDHVCRHVFSSYSCHTISIRFCLLPECIAWPSGTPSDSVEVFCSSNKQLTVNVPVGEWCHLLWTLDSQQETVYFNGKRLGATVSDGLCSIFDVELRTNFFGFPSETPARTKEEDYCFVFHGLLDEFHVRKCVLLEKDIQNAVQTRLYRLPSRPDYADFIGENCLAYGSRVAQVLCTQPHEKIGEIVPLSRYSRSSKARKESAGPRWWPWQRLW